MRTLLGKFELLNLKSIIRTFVHGSTEEGIIDPFIFSLGRYHTIPIQEALEADDLEKLVAAMERTPFSRPLELGYQRYESEGGIFPLELALDLDYYERQWEALDTLGPFDRQNASRLLGIQYDITNLVWIFRFKQYYSFSPEQISQYIIPHGWKISGDVFRTIAASDDVAASVVNLRLDPYNKLLGSVSHVDDNFIMSIELNLSRYLYHESLRTFMKFPLQAAQLIAFFICKEMEIRDIITILSGKHLGLSQERIRPYMITL